MTQPHSAPALARTDVRPAEPESTPPARKRIPTAIAIGATVFAVVVVLLVGLVFALRADPSLLSADVLSPWR